MAKIVKRDGKAPVSVPEPDGKEVSWLVAGMSKDFDQLVKDRQNADTIIKQYEGVKKAASEKILAMMTKRKFGKITDLEGGFTVIRAKGSSASKLDKGLLLACGVDAADIEASTVPGTSYEYIQVRKGKESDE